MKKRILIEFNKNLEWRKIHFYAHNDRKMCTEPNRGSVVISLYVDAKALMIVVVVVVVVTIDATFRMLCMFLFSIEKLSSMRTNLPRSPER